MTSRRRARRLAVDILYQADLTGTQTARVLSTWAQAERERPAFTIELAEGVAEYETEIDLLLEEHAEGWSVARMAALDRTILRVAVFELLHRPDVPTSVAISEAVQAAVELSTEDSGRFVNGILGRIARELPDQPGDPPI